MLTGKELILATKPFAKENRRKSWEVTIVTLSLWILALCGTVLLPFLALRILSSLLAGLLIIRSFIIYHDHQHHSILTHSKVADFIMKGFGLYILSPASIWKRSHDHHHKHNSKLFSASIGSYPVATKTKFLNMSRKERIGYLATRHPVTVALGYISMFIIGMCVMSFASSPKKHFDSLVALVLHFSASVAVIFFLGWESYFLLVVLPLTIACGLGAYLFYAQHNFPGVKFCENGAWAYEKAALESSSYMKMHPVMAWFTGNIGYHHIHHLNSRIPFYRLPETMAAFPELQNCGTTSLGWKDIRDCFRLKVWDQELGRMISLKEIRQSTPDLRRQAA